MNEIKQAETSNCLLHAFCTVVSADTLKMIGSSFCMDEKSITSQQTQTDSITDWRRPW